MKKLLGVVGHLSANLALNLFWLHMPLIWAAVVALVVTVATYYLIPPPPFRKRKRR